VLYRLLILLLVRRQPGAVTMRQLTPRQLMVPALVGLTLVHLGIRLSARADGQPAFVSSLRAGDAVKGAVLPSGADEGSQACLQVIVFSPDCPFCQHAADRESKTLTEASRERRLWFTDSETARLPHFVAEKLHRQPGISAELVQALEVRAVPALFVLSPGGEIRWVGAYYGDETDQELRTRCTLAPNQEPKT
jgi:hypothetical protein